MIESDHKTKSARANRLSSEKSPYLLQHAHNPVDWYAWNREAFDKSRSENKPIFLSIGYSTCHWCHVMERESFEDEKVGEFLNEHFVSIKLDREERPDVDKIYMTFVQATNGSGGWPLNVFLTPELKPFYGGTYFPSQPRHGLPSFLQLIEHIHDLWETRRDELARSAAKVHEQLEHLAAHSGDDYESASSVQTLRQAAERLKESYDPRNGGFGGAPKFPHPAQPQLLLRCAKRFGDSEAANMVLKTCDRMASGGIHDQLGGGFSRYSVDAEWLVPHFEKMLYDNAQLAHLYLDAYVFGGDSRHAAIVRDILDYVLRDMTHPEGGFFSAEDADSEGYEGKFYCWERSQLSALLTPEEFNVAVSYFGVTQRGNFVDHSHPQPLQQQNVLSVVQPDLSAADMELLKSAKAKMLPARNGRVRPHLDDKVLVSWNGLMLGAFARASVVLGDGTYRTAAKRNLAFIQSKLWEPRDSIKPGTGRTVGTLFHRWRDGGRDFVQLIEAYAFLLDGVIHLYESTLAPDYLDFAVELAEAMLEKFYDVENGGFWQSGTGASDLILRVKEDYDGAEPSGNSVAILALLKLGPITGRQDFTAAGEKGLTLFSRRLEQFPQAVPYLLQALDFSLQEPKRAVLAGDPELEMSGKLLRAIHSTYEPNKVVLGTLGSVEEFAKSLPVTSSPAVHVCSGTFCNEPTTDCNRVGDLLK